MRREVVLDRLEELIQRLELIESQPFRVKAYEHLWNTLAGLPLAAWESSEALQHSLSGISGIGEALRRTARDLYETGTTPLLEELKEKVPESILELRRLPGLGPKRIQELWRELHITTVDGLAQAIERGKLKGRRGWTVSLLQRVMEGIALYRAQRHLILYSEALTLWETATAPLREKGISIQPVGELRRALPLVEKVEGILLAEWTEAVEASGWKADTPHLLRHSHLPVQLHLVEKREWGKKLIELTGPPSFWEKLQKRLPPTADYASEEALFEAAGLPYILPAWRDWEDIIELAEKRRLPPPIHPEDIQGSLHVHTTYSDGADSLEAMAEAARSYGWKWLGIADHSQRAAYAGGLPPEKLLQQVAAIQSLNQQYQGSFYLLAGVEADILPDGQIDYDESIWRRLDYLVASVHEKLHMSREEATQRLERALSNPFVRVLGHWTGRLLRSRPGYPIDEEKILQLCAERGVVIEFNANPYRMEIDWRWVRRAAELGVQIILTTDAHAIRELEYWRIGLAVLQKGLLPPSLLLNTAIEPPFIKQKNSVAL